MTIVTSPDSEKMDAYGLEPDTTPERAGVVIKDREPKGAEEHRDGSKRGSKTRRSLQWILIACTAGAALAAWSVFANNVGSLDVIEISVFWLPAVLFGTGLLSRWLRLHYGWSIVLCGLGSTAVAIAVLGVIWDLLAASYRTGTNGSLCYADGTGPPCSFHGTLPLLSYVACFVVGAAAMVLSVTALARDLPR